MDSDRLQVGIEVEYPVHGSRSHPLRSLGAKSDGVYREIGEAEGTSWSEGGEVTRDVSVGLEVVSGPSPDERGGIPVAEAPDWYDSTLDHIAEYNSRFAPVGRMQSRDQTAGLHIHFSHPDTEGVFEFGEWLANISEEEWMQVFACSTIADQNTSGATGRVFRGDRHVDLGEYNRSRTSVVHAVSRSSGHYEWRLPEPMLKENFELLMGFLERAADNRHDAVQWARDDIVYQGDSRLTSVRRANEVGLQEYYPDTHIDGVQVVRGVDHQTSDFHDAVFQSSEMPYIFRVHTEDGRFADTYYIMVSHANRNYDGVSSYEHLFPDDLSETNRWVIRRDSDSMALPDDEEAAAIIDAANDENSSTQEIPSTDATDLLLDSIA